MIPAGEVLHIFITIILGDYAVKLTSIQKWSQLSENVFVLEPRVSVVGIETGSQKFTVKRMNGINCGSMAVYGVHDAGGDSIFSKTITIINEDTNR